MLPEFLKQMLVDRGRCNEVVDANGFVDGVGVACEAARTDVDGRNIPIMHQKPCVGRGIESNNRRVDSCLVSGLEG